MIPSLDTHISDHFTYSDVVRSEIASRRGIDNIPSGSLIPTLTNTAKNLEGVRNVLLKPIIVSSWFRCLTLNQLLGSKDTSQHTVGEAVDFESPTFGSPYRVCKAIINAGELVPFDQLILEHEWVHISFCSDPSMKPRSQVISLLQSGGYAKGLTDKFGHTLIS